MNDIFLRGLSDCIQGIKTFRDEIMSHRGDEIMTANLKLFLRLLFILLPLTMASVAIAEPQKAPEAEKKVGIALSEDMGQAMMQEAARVKEDLEMQAHSLFQRKPLGWDLKTIRHLNETIFSFHRKLPELTGQVLGQMRLYGVVGSLMILIFMAAVLYSLLGQARVLRWFESKGEPLGRRIPETGYPFFQSGLKVLVSALIPIALFLFFSLIHAMIAYKAPWLRLVGRLLGLWAAVALILRLLKELLTRGFFPATAQYGKRLYRRARLLILFTTAGFAVFYCAQAFGVTGDVRAFIKFTVSLFSIFLLFHVLFRKQALLSLFPEIPYRGYQGFLKFLRSYYKPLMGLSFIASLLWCFGYENFGRLILTKIWFTAGALFIILLVFHGLDTWLKRWTEKLRVTDEAAQFLARSLKSLFLYATLLAGAIILLYLIGVLGLLQRIMSFPIFLLGDNPVSFWIILKAVLILIGFIFASRLLQAYLNYKIYPSLHVDAGLAYALNTFFKYVSIALGLLISLEIVGIDLRFLLVFAGAVGIGIGFGLQNMASNFISGFLIIFGGKIRKGDWIEVGNTLGTVTDIYLRATSVRTRDNVEFLIPNSELISKTIVNYSLSSPMIRIEVPVGVSYNADPAVVEKILLAAAEKEPQVSDYEMPVVRFTEYGDSSINFELLIWIDVREVPRRKVRSALYFSIFEEFRRQGIEIPFPQRDIHIRSKAGEEEKKGEKDDDEYFRGNRKEKECKGILE